MLWDTHMHTHFSTDSQADTEEMIQASVHAEVDGICFTDHLDLDYDSSNESFILDIPEYFREMQAVRKKYDGRFPVLTGIEIGLQPHLADRLPQIIEQYPFDFVIGSSHVVHGQDPYYPEYYLGKTETEAYREYFESILENLAALDCFDVYGHLDYVVRYGPTKNENYSYDKFSDVLDEILRALIEKGKGLELNTGGFKYGLGHPNPTERVLKRYQELGGEIITVGADGHKPEHVAYDFAKVPEILKQAGFEYYTVFQERKPVFYRL